MTPAGAWRSAFVSHQGAVRAVNEDAFFDAPDIGVWAVADGMGGHEGGRLASTMVVDALDALPAGLAPATIVTEVRRHLDGVNRRLLDVSAERFGGRTIGTTVAVLIRDGAAAVCLWAGDSRIYRLRDGRLQRLTRDHSRVEELIDRGLLAPGAADGHRLANVITRAVGVRPQLDLDEAAETVRPGDRFLLCSDGLTRTVPDADLERMLCSGTCEAAAELVLQEALRRRPADNVTLGVVDVATDDSTAVGPSPQQR